MPIDASIYQNLRPVEMPDLMGSMGKAMSLKQLAMQNQVQQRAFDDQQAIRQAYQKNLGADGSVNQSGVYTTLGEIGAGHLIPQQREAFNKFNKDEAEATTKGAEAQNSVQGILSHYYDIVKKAAPDQQEALYNGLRADALTRGVPAKFIPEKFDPAHFGRDSYIASNSTPRISDENTKAKTEEALASAAKLRSETIKQNPIVGQNDDPAKLVPGMVPKEHQQRALSEIEAAENTQHMGKSIVDSFDQAVQDIQGLGRVGAMVKTPRSVLALHQSMQPTFKDLEGTVRQAAMDNTFKNITPSPLDTARDIQTKREALQEYLKSKMSAPTARAYGIDLGKFDSTKPYVAENMKTDSGDTGVINSANASSDRKAPHGHNVNVGGVVAVGGKNYKVGPDGDTLIPIKVNK